MRDTTGHEGSQRVFKTLSNNVYLYIHNRCKGFRQDINKYNGCNVNCFTVLQDITFPLMKLQFSFVFRYQRLNMMEVLMLRRASLGGTHHIDHHSTVNLLDSCKQQKLLTDRQTERDRDINIHLPPK